MGDCPRPASAEDTATAPDRAASGFLRPGSDAVVHTRSR